MWIKKRDWFVLISEAVTEISQFLKKALAVFLEVAVNFDVTAVI